MNGVYIIQDDASLALFRATRANPSLHKLVDQIVERAKAQGCWDALTCVSIVAPGAPLSALADLLGVEPQHALWDWRIVHGRYQELGLTAGDSGFAHIVILRSDDARLAT
jgi:hypothetical protein